MYVDLELAGVGGCSNKDRTEVRVIYICCGGEKRGETEIILRWTELSKAVVEKACYKEKELKE